MPLLRGARASAGEGDRAVRALVDAGIHCITSEVVSGRPIGRTRALVSVSATRARGVAQAVAAGRSGRARGRPSRPSSSSSSTSSDARNRPSTKSFGSFIRTVSGPKPSDESASSSGRPLGRRSSGGLRRGWFVTGDRRAPPLAFDERVDVELLVLRDEGVALVLERVAGTRRRRPDRTACPENLWSSVDDDVDRERLAIGAIARSSLRRCPRPRSRARAGGSARRRADPDSRDPQPSYHSWWWRTQGTMAAQELDGLEDLRADLGMLLDLVVLVRRRVASGLVMIASGMPILPTSWSSPAK